MADDVTFQSGTLATPPDGTVVGADVIAGVTYQRAKLVWGADGVATDASAAAPLPVTMSGATLPVTLSGATVSVSTGLSLNSGNTDATTLRVITAADGPLNTNLGTTADAVITTDTTGSISGKMRGLVKWAYERMPASLGQKAKSASFPVVVASDQDALPVTDNSGSLTVDSNVKLLYGTEAQGLTCTLTSLASSATAGRESTAVSNTTNLFTDVLLMARVKLQSGTIGNDKRAYVWAYGTVDGTTPIYPDTVTGSDAAITMNSPVNLRLLGVIECPAQSTSYTGGPWSLAQLFGSVPQKWGVVVQNYTNIGFSTVAADSTVIWQGVKAQLA